MKNRNGVRWLAEFLVVVLGILGAFAIEDWSAKRADRALELAYLEQLQRDLQADDAEMDENRYAALQRALSVGRVMDEAGLEFEPMRSPAFSVPLDFSDTLTVDPCPALMSCLVNYRTYDGSRAAYDELVNTGNLRVIQNRALVRALAVYYARTVSETDADQNLGRPDVLALGRALNRHGFPVSRGSLQRFLADRENRIRSSTPTEKRANPPRDGASCRELTSSRRQQMPV
jgi:hypothetical protein